MKRQISLRSNTGTLLSPVAVIKLTITTRSCQSANILSASFFNNFTMIVSHQGEVLNKLATVGFSHWGLEEVLWGFNLWPRLFRLGSLSVWHAKAKPISSCWQELHLYLADMKLCLLHWCHHLALSSKINVTGFRGVSTFCLVCACSKYNKKPNVLLLWWSVPALCFFCLVF